MILSGSYSQSWSWQEVWSKEPFFLISPGSSYQVYPIRQLGVGLDPVKKHHLNSHLSWLYQEAESYQVYPTRQIRVIASYQAVRSQWSYQRVKSSFLLYPICYLRSLQAGKSHQTRSYRAESTHDTSNMQAKKLETKHKGFYFTSIELFNKMEDSWGFFPFIKSGCGLVIAICW